MKKICRYWFFPVSFVFADVYKLLLFYIGLAYGENRVYDIIYPAGCALFALACGICFLYTIKERVKSRRTAAALLLPAAALLRVPFFVSIERKLTAYHTDIRL